MSVTTITVPLPGGRGYPILAGGGAWESLPAHLAARPPQGVAVVSDETVFPLWGERLLALLRSSGHAPLVHLVPAGEGSKSFSELGRACRAFAAAALPRESVVLALGGGVVGDLAGLSAALYLRGVRLVQLPTSLLAMVDSSVGGKTAVDIPEGKNLVGAFHQPEAVFADTSCLATLPPRQWWSGMGEVVKTALALDLALLDHLEQRGCAPGGPDAAHLVERCCRAKAAVVAEDEREGGRRRVLNFGHTLAHALEAAGGYRDLLHGEAVAAGMGAALVLSRERCGLPEGDFARARALVRALPLPPLPSPGPDLIPFLARDKKVGEGGVTAVLLERLGRPRMVPLADLSLWGTAWDRWRTLAD